MASDEVDVEKLDITDELIAERHDFVPGQTPEEMTSWQRPITAVIDIVNLWAGRIISLMLVPLIAIVVYAITHFQHRRLNGVVVVITVFSIVHIAAGCSASLNGGKRISIIIMI